MMLTRIFTLLWTVAFSAGLTASVAHGDGAEALRTKNPLLEPWRISHFPELEGRGLRCIAEDHAGNIWFGLRDGVVRYNGYEWKDFGPDDGLPGTEVFSIVRRSSGQLIAATHDGLFEQHGRKWRRLFPADEGVRLRTSYVIEADDGAIWVCTRWGLIRLNGTAATLFTSEAVRPVAEKTGLYDQVIALPDECFPRTRHYPGSDIRLIKRTVASMGKNSPARAASLRLGDRILSVNGKKHNILSKLRSTPGKKLTLLVERQTTGEQEEITFSTSMHCEHFRDPAMNSAMQDRDGAIWGCMVRGTVIISPDQGDSWKTLVKKDKFPIESFPYPLEASDGSVWMFSAGREANANRFDGQHWTTNDLSMLGDKTFISSAAQTADGTIWVGGLNKIHVHRYGQWTTMDTRDVQIPSESPRLMVASDEAIWIGGYNQGAVRIAMAEEEFLSLDGSEHLCTEASGTQWFVHEGRLVRKDDTQTMTYDVDDGTIDHPVAMAAVSQGVVAFGSHHNVAAVSTFRDGTWHRKLFPEVASTFNKKGFTVTQTGTVWISAIGRRDIDQAGGLVHGDGQTWQQFSPPNAPLYSNFSLEFPDGRMWFGGGYGVFQFDGKKWTRVKDKLLKDSSFPAGTINSKGTVFLATRTKGIVKYEDDKWTNLTTEHGLASNEISAVHVDLQDRLWVTTRTEISRLEGDHFVQVDLPQKMGRDSIRSTPQGSVWIDGILRLGNDPAGARTHLDRTNLTLANDGEAIVTWYGVDRWNRTAADHLRWAWRLDGAPWSEFTTDHQVAIRNLDVGDHVFEVINRDGDGNTSDSVEAIPITVLAPFWQQPWFVLLCSVIAALLLWQAFGLFRRGAVLRNTNQQLTTAQLQLADRFADQTAQFRAICDCSPVGIFVTNAVGETTYLNKYLCRLSDLQTDAPDDATWLAAVHDDDRAGMAAEWYRVQNEELPFRYSARFQHQDGSIRWFEVLADRVDRDGIFRGYVGVVEDITERRLAGEEIKEANLQLRSALGQLQVAQEQVVKRERLNALGQMAAGVAHDINNTLTPLMLYAELLQQEPELSAEGQERAELLRLGVSDTAETVRRLNHFYRPAHNRDFAETVDIADIVRQAVELTKPRWFDKAQAEGKQIDLMVEIMAEPCVLGEGSQLRSVLTNLIFNAVDAISDVGEITIRIEQNGKLASIEVRDTGQGMNADELTRCTDPFYTSKSHGSGLGLSECFGIVRQHGGELAITSVVDHGTTVRFELPCTTERPAKRIRKDNVQTISAPHAGSVPLPRQTRALYIDDNELVRQSTAALLSRLDVNVETANDGPEGLEKLEHSSFHFVLLDQGLPGMDGLTVLKKIKERWPDLPVAMVSGWTLPALEAGCGPDDFIEKPFTLAQLTRLVKKYLERDTSSV